MSGADCGCRATGRATPGERYRIALEITRKVGERHGFRGTPGCLDDLHAQVLAAYILDGACSTHAGAAAEKLRAIAAATFESWAREDAAS